eukprot:1157976-Pelagomonas_calceolata.AAC.2
MEHAATQAILRHTRQPPYLLLQPLPLILQTPQLPHAARQPQHAAPPQRQPPPHAPLQRLAAAHAYLPQSALSTRCSPGRSAAQLADPPRARWPVLQLTPLLHTATATDRTRLGGRPGQPPACGTRLGPVAAAPPGTPHCPVALPPPKSGLHAVPACRVGPFHVNMYAAKLLLSQGP